MKKTWLITGASGAIGGMCAYKAALRKDNIVMVYRTGKEICEDLADQLRGLGSEVLTVGGDITSAADRDSIITEALAKFKTVDYLINNAGTASYGLFTEQEEREIEQIILTDLTAAMLFTKQLLPHLYAKHSGSVVNVGSIWGLTGASCEVAYSAAKAGLIGFTKALAKEAAGAGVRVNCVAPGCVDSKMMAHFSEAEKKDIVDSIPLGRMADAGEIADSILFMATQEYITGQVLSPNGGMVI